MFTSTEYGPTNAESVSGPIAVLIKLKLSQLLRSVGSYQSTGLQNVTQEGVGFSHFPHHWNNKSSNYGNTDLKITFV
uniref:(California timema) hypothetical protein n=1 Tax=Timema californicum TaxID=61474 RepID=A0A7R9J0V8_TIMCA|nr:unnamed protein product [Timema californicum]